jgi:ABC-2 type transport system permease protein
MKPHRIWALFSRHLYLYRRSIQRIMEIIYWPVLDLLLWGFITVYLQRYQEGLPGFVTFFIGALILWDILFRAQQGVCLSFLEEVWSRNLLNLFVSPLRPAEFLISTMLISVMKVLFSATATVVLAWIFYSYNLFTLGVSLIPFVLNLILMGWAVGVFTTGLILRYGQQAEVMAWGLVLFFQPFAAVFYPVSVLPPSLQPIAWMLPASHVFEGMRQVIGTGEFPIRSLAWAFGLNLIYIALALLHFYRMFRIVRRQGLLVKVGE